MLQPSQVIDGRYRVESIIDGGGVADVYSVEHIRLGSRHALKIPHGVPSPEAALALALEGRIQAFLQHRTVVRVTDAFDFEGVPVLVMDYVDGPCLREWINCRLPERREPAVVLEIFRELVRGVHHAHSHGIVHRDLNPGNVFLTESARRIHPRIADFGLAKLLRPRVGWPAEVHYRFVGTIGYASPEQVADPAGIDERADLFSLGCILYEMLVQSPAFLGSEDEVNRAMAAAAAVPPSEVLGRGMPELDELVAALLAPDPEQRPRDCRALSAALSQLTGLWSSVDPDPGGPASASSSSLDPLGPGS